jgi:hypothetical protein
MARASNSPRSPLCHAPPISQRERPAADSPRYKLLTVKYTSDAMPGAPSFRVVCERVGDHITSPDDQEPWTAAKTIQSTAAIQPTTQSPLRANKLQSKQKFPLQSPPQHKPPDTSGTSASTPAALPTKRRPKSVSKGCAVVLRSCRRSRHARSRVALATTGRSLFFRLYIPSLLIH